MEYELVVDERKIGQNQPTYFIADIAANHDGNLGRAKELIYLAKQAGADAAKFQHFRAETIVSDIGFRALGQQQSHQAKWKKSVSEVYRDASVSTEWTQILKATCEEVGITFFTSPYDLEIVEQIDPYVPAYKIGSGDITWLEMIELVASKGKPVFLATGASTLDEVIRAVETALALNKKLVLMQCNTNYTGNIENMRYVQLNVLKTYRSMFPELILGLSDHTPGHATVLGAIALGARVVEKHFTDDTNRDGPDHQFSMNPSSWRDMIDRSRELESALGTGCKKVEDNERQTVVLQRRAVRLAKPLAAGHLIQRDDLTFLRPAPMGSFAPHQLNIVVGRRLRKDLVAGVHLTHQDLD
jgi:sialic acid synthase SpsE